MFTRQFVLSAVRRRHGMTMIETMLVLGVVGIVGAIAVPSFVTWRREMLLTQAAQQVRFELNLAQTESIKLNKHVSFYRIGDDAYRIGAHPKRLLPLPVSFVSGPDSVRFAPFGPPTTGAAQFRLELDGRARVVEVSLGGHVSAR